MTWTYFKKHYYQLKNSDQAYNSIEKLTSTEFNEFIRFFEWVLSELNESTEFRFFQL